MDVDAGRAAPQPLHDPATARQFDAFLGEDPQHVPAMHARDPLHPRLP